MHVQVEMAFGGARRPNSSIPSACPRDLKETDSNTNLSSSSLPSPLPILTLLPSIPSPALADSTLVAPPSHLAFHTRSSRNLSPTTRHDRHPARPPCPPGQDVPPPSEGQVVQAVQGAHLVPVYVCRYRGFQVAPLAGRSQRASTPPRTPLPLVPSLRMPSSHPLVVSVSDHGLLFPRPQLQSPLASYTGKALATRVGLSPIMRAGNGMVEPLLEVRFSPSSSSEIAGMMVLTVVFRSCILQLFPESPVYHLGLYRCVAAPHLPTRASHPRILTSLSPLTRLQ